MARSPVITTMAVSVSLVGILVILTSPANSAIARAPEGGVYPAGPNSRPAWPKRASADGDTAVISNELPEMKNYDNIAQPYSLVCKIGKIIRKAGRKIFGRRRRRNLVDDVLLLPVVPLLGKYIFVT